MSRVKSKPNSPHILSSKAFCRVRDRAKRKGIAFDLTREWVLAKMLGVCEATGVEFDFERLGVKSRNKNYPSIDRIDQQKGYTKDNCRMVTYQFNACRGSWGDHDVIAFATAVVNFNKANSYNAENPNTFND